MQYANIAKKTRNTLWPAVKAPDYTAIEPAKKWCQEHPSNGKFYYHYTNTRWWFEKEEDALLFALRWSGVTYDK